MLEKDKEEVNKLIEDFSSRPTTPENTQVLASLYQVKALWGLRVTLFEGFDKITDVLEERLRDILNAIDEK